MTKIQNNILNNENDKNRFGYSGYGEILKSAKTEITKNDQGNRDDVKNKVQLVTLVMGSWQNIGNVKIMKK